MLKILRLRVLYKYNTRFIINSVSDSLNNEQSQMDLPESLYQTVMRAHPRLYVHKPTVWNAVYGTLLKQGFEVSFIQSMLLNVPQILDTSPDNLDAVIKVFRGYKLQEDNIVKLITREPRLLVLDREAIQTRLGLMFTVFPKADIVKMLKQEKCVGAMFFEDWDSIMEKLKFIDAEMGYDQGQIVVSNALSYSLDYIKMRYALFNRCGKYKRPNPKVRNTKELKLRTILNTDDEELPARTGISKEEYNIFVQLFEEELEMDSNESNDSD